MVCFRHVIYTGNSNPVRSGTNDNLFDKVIVQNIMTLNVLLNGNDNQKNIFFYKNGSNFVQNLKIHLEFEVKRK